MAFSVQTIRAIAMSALIPGAILLTPFSANAASYSFKGQIPNGADPLGGQYSVGINGLSGAESFSETASDQSDPTQDPTFQPSAGGLLDATAFIFTEVGSAVDPINPNFGTGFTQDNVGDWTPTYTTNSQGAIYSVEFDAPTGGQLSSGDQFFTTVGFDSALPANFAYTVTYSGDAVSAAPEPSTWLLMIVGLGMLGGLLRLDRRQGSGMAGA